uniref:Uncharacterized protein n=1 Tax=Anguilla anguilla TaxID=7936 RepID=A0A0E9U8Z3_ANGAN
MDLVCSGGLCRNESPSVTFQAQLLLGF